MKTLYNELKERGIEIGNHESDLYFPSTPETKAILAKYPLQKLCSTSFINNIDKTLWIDVPFGFDPYWEAKENVIRVNRERNLNGNG